MSMSCVHAFIEDYRQGVNVCTMCGLVSNDLIFGGDCYNNKRVEAEEEENVYIRELNSSVVDYKYNFLNQDYNRNDFANHVHIYKLVLKIWPKKRGRPRLDDMAAVLFYYIYKNITFISLWDMSIYSNQKKEELYKIYCILSDYSKKYNYYNSNTREEGEDTFMSRDRNKMNKLSELYCFKIGRDNFKMYKNVSLMANIIYMQYNFTSPLRAITAIALYIYCTDIVKPCIKISFKQIISMSGSSKSCLKRLQKIYIADKNLYITLYMKKQI